MLWMWDRVASVYMICAAESNNTIWQMRGMRGISHMGRLETNINGFKPSVRVLVDPYTAWLTQPSEVTIFMSSQRPPRHLMSRSDSLLFSLKLTVVGKDGDLNKTSSQPLNICHFEQVIIVGIIGAAGRPFPQSRGWDGWEFGTLGSCSPPTATHNPRAFFRPFTPTHPRKPHIPARHHHSTSSNLSLSTRHTSISNAIHLNTPALYHLSCIYCVAVTSLYASPYIRLHGLLQSLRPLLIPLSNCPKVTSSPSPQGDPDSRSARTEGSAFDVAQLTQGSSLSLRTATPGIRDPSATLSELQDAATGPSVSSKLEFAEPAVHCEYEHKKASQEHADVTAATTEDETEQSPPPQYPASEASSSRPPPFSSLFAPLIDAAGESSSKFVGAASTQACASGSVAAPAYSSSPSLQSTPSQPDGTSSRAFYDPVGETKRALPQDTKAELSRKDEDTEPPPAYSEGDSPLHAFTYVMSVAGGAASIITQVQQGGPPINAIGDGGTDETIAMDLRGTKFVLSREELLTLPEFVLLSLFPNGLFPEGHMNGFSESDAVQVDYDPVSLQYMLDFFRNVAQTMPAESSPGASQDGEAMAGEPLGSRDDSSKRAGIIVLREDLDFYVIPPKADIGHPAMIEVKRAAAEALQRQDGIFSGLKRSDEPGTTEAHLIEMLTAGGFNHDDTWGHRAGEPNKAVICSLALARLRSDIRGSDMGTNAVGMAQKLLLFWRKPARRCWWEGVELDNVDGVQGKLKVWIRRVWTLEMSVIGLC
ncbi:peroxin 20 [Metarhizium album ARSEF 1941]|uniref:Peroxin 20 n=1 Tax=Metarhizium album (strain ARSEF 1941) TaxID=1081103 RepID=A0A0B2WZN7_METAS|nr:peroxin 20 [Metarhizium album ARSEF 1941]KHN99054.1 peroxin 20 [Metarhizium album ARSEF 1941]